MFSLGVLIMQYAMLVSIVLFIPVTFTYRLIFVLKSDYKIKNKLLIALLPFSIGYYLLVPKNKKTKVYFYLMLAFLTLSTIGILFTLYQRIVPSYT